MGSEIFLGMIVFLWGLAAGSFLNVCIHRMPREESIVRPGSHCPQCQKPIAWYDNIPLVSYLLLGGKCRHCRARIPSRYFLVELLTGFLWFWLWRRFGFTAHFVAAVFLFSVLVAITVIDFETGLIPDRFTIPGMVFGVVMAVCFPALLEQKIWYDGAKDSVIGLLAGGGSLLAIGLIGNFIFRKESMGGGDIKLLALLGAFLGFKKVILVLLVAPILAIPLALFAKLVQKAETIPFGPFIALAGAWLFL